MYVLREILLLGTSVRHFRIELPLCTQMQIGIAVQIGKIVSKHCIVHSYSMQLTRDTEKGKLEVVLQNMLRENYFTNKLLIPRRIKFKIQFSIWIFLISYII